ncbi:MAG: mechanosensitive ion channel [Alphaproteobacteria bacterium]|nr:mechanosensitive ion channel [Alphaproteobacteria bacterium]
MTLARVAVLATFALLLGARAALAQDVRPPPNTDVDALIRVLEDDQARARLLDELRRLAPPTQPPGTAAPPQAAAVPLDAVPGAVPLGRPNSGAGALVLFSNALSSIGDRIADIAFAMSSPRGIARWFAEQSAPERRQFWMALLAYLASTVFPALVVWWAARRLLRPATDKLERRAAAASWWRRIPYAAANILLLVAPIAAFAVVGFAFLAILRTPDGVRLIILPVLTAVIAALASNAVAKAILAPLAPALRPVPLRNEVAAYLYVWVRRMVDLLVYGYFLTQAVLLLGVPPAAYAFLVRLIGLLLALLVGVLVLQNRQPVQRWLGGLGGERVRPAAVRVVRERVAASWHILALLYVTAAWAVWMLDIPGGFTLIARNTLATVGIILLAWFAVRFVGQVLHRAFGVSEDIRKQYPFAAARADLYLPLARRGIVVLVQAVAALAILQVWGVDILAWFASDAGRQVLSRAMHIAVILGIALLALELSNALVHLYLDVRSEDEDHMPSQRIRTLLPLIRNVLIVVISVMTGLVVLSELGVSIGPLLAGAGVAGVAIGFGAQTLVKDFITGVFILIEDSLHVGDVARLGGKEGVVESMTIRTVRLRDTDGTVYTIPFSSVAMIENLTKDFSYAVVDVRVAYNQDYERVVAVLKDIGHELKSDARLGRGMLGPIEIMGLEEITDTALVVRVRIKTRPQRQWELRREFNRRVKLRFDREGIEFPFPRAAPPFKAIADLRAEAEAKPDAPPDAQPAKP